MANSESAPILSGASTPMHLAAPKLGGFWRRAVAFVIDWAVLWGFGLLLEYIAFDALVRLGRFGSLMGCVIATAYFGLLNSSVGGGRTVGKRLTGVRVVGRDGACVSPFRSIARTLLITVPLFNAGWPWHAYSSYSPVGFWIDFAEVVPLSTTIYLIACNRRTRQGLHDLATGTFVVTGESGPVSTRRVWPGHLGSVALIIAVFSFAFVYQKRQLRLAIPFQNLNSSPLAERALSAITRSGLGHTASVGGSLLYPSGTDATVAPTLEASVQWRSRPENVEAAAAAIAKILLREIPIAETAETVTLTIEYGFDLGFAHSHRSQKFRKSPAGWRAITPAR